jgi:hypothetical protein
MDKILKIKVTDEVGKEVEYNIDYRLKESMEFILNYLERGELSNDFVESFVGVSKVLATESVQPVRRSDTMHIKVLTDKLERK